MTFRPDQTDRFRKLTRALASLSDDDLERLQLKWRDRVVAMIDDTGNIPDDPVKEVEIQMADILTDECNYRHEVIWHYESDLMGGHNVRITWGDDPSKYHAVCLPYEDICWESPDRDTFDEALAEGRAHHPGYEPSFEDWIKREA